MKNPSNWDRLLSDGELPSFSQYISKEAFANQAEAMEASLASVPFPFPFPGANRTVGRPKRGEEVEGTETLSLRLPKSMIEEANRVAHRLGVSRNRFFKIGLIRMIEDPILEGELKMYKTAEITNSVKVSIAPNVMTGTINYGHGIVGNTTGTSPKKDQPSRALQLCEAS